MKKPTSIIALTLAMIITLTACGGTNAELLEFIVNTGNDVDYGGYQFKYYLGVVSGYDAEKSIVGYDRNTLQGEAMLKRVSDIKEQINVEMIFDYSYDHQAYQTAAMSGNIDADAITFNHMNAMQSLALSGFLYPITDFSDYIDLNDTDKYGAANVLEAGMINSVPYAVLPCFWPGQQPMDSFILTYNKDLTIPNGITDFHEFWEEKNWTWKTFETEFLDKAYVQKDEGYIYTISTTPIQYFSSLLYANNVQFIKRDKDTGENIVNPYPESFIHAYEKGLDWANRYKDTIFFEDGVQGLYHFMAETSMTGLASAAEVTTGHVSLTATFDYGLMPFPAGPDAPYGVWAQYMQRINGVGIAKVSKEPEIAAHTISLWFEPFEEFGGRDGLYDFYNTYVFLTETDTQIFFELMKHVRYDYTFWNQANAGRKLHEDFGTSIQMGMGISEAMERNRNIVDTMIKEHIEPNFDYMYDNYYYQFDN